MSSSAHARYSERLASLATGVPILTLFADTRLFHRRVFAQHRWVRTYGRFTPDHEPYATLCFETSAGPQVIVRVSASTTRPQVDEHETPVVFDPTIGWLSLNLFPTDPHLPTLPTVLVGVERATIMRYRPFRRCTLRVDERDTTRFVKVFPTVADGERLHREAVALWGAAQQRELKFRVAPPGHWDAATCALWQYQAKGIPAAPLLFGPDGALVAHRMGRAAASLACSSLQPTEIFAARVQMARSLRYGEEIVSRVPQASHAVDTLLQPLTSIHARVRSRPLRPIHGGLHAHQWLDDGSELALVDFDRFSRGDPELDVATFLGELDFETDLQVPPDQLADAFLQSYESISGPLDRQLLAAYRAHKRLAKVLRTARAVRPDGDRRTLRHLRRAIDALHEIA
jgi:hypothetical protein